MLYLRSAIGLLAEVEQVFSSGNKDLALAKIEDAKYFLEKFLQKISDSERTPDDSPVKRQGPQ
jgi:hypothetical protein